MLNTYTIKAVENWLYTKRTEIINNPTATANFEDQTKIKLIDELADELTEKRRDIETAQEAMEDIL